MARPRPPRYLRLIGWLSALVPMRLRGDWRREWEAELQHREIELRAWREERDVGRQLWATSRGAAWDVLWLQRQRWEDDVVQDIRYAFRLFRRAPGLALAGILSVGLGIGATTSVFTLINAALLRPLPYPDVDRLVTVTTDQSRLFSVPGFLQVQAGNRSLDQLAAVETMKFVIGGGHPVQVTGQLVTAEFLPLVGLDGPLRPSPGRPFTREEFGPAAPAVVLISHRLWQTRFGGAVDVVGTTIPLDATPTTIVGVLPERFDFFASSDLIAPLTTQSGRAHDPLYHSLEIVGRLKRSVPAADAARQITALLERETPPPTASIAFVRETLVQDFRRSILILWAMTGLVLLVGCLNFANLLAARTTARAHELAVRTGLGARRFRLVRQLVTEALVLAIAGGLVGLAAAYGGRGLLLAATTSHFLGASDVPLDLRVVGFALSVSMAAGLVFGLTPAIKGLAADRLEPYLKRGAGSRGLSGSGAQGVSTTLAAAQVAVTLVLLAGAGLLLKSFWKLASYEPGYDATHGVTLHFELPETSYPEDADVTRFIAAFTEAATSVPGIHAIGAASSLPLVESGFRFRAVAMEGGPTGPVGPPERLPLGILPPPPPPAPPAGVTLPFPIYDFFMTFSGRTSPGFFSAMRIPLVQGRDFTAEDGPGTAPVAMVNQAFVDRYWRGVDPIGRRIRNNPVEPWITVVGVVGNIRRFSRDDDIRAEVYRPLSQQGDRRRGDRRPGQAAVGTYTSDVYFVVRTTAAPDEFARTARALLASIDPTLPIADVATLQGTLDAAIAPRRFLLRLFVVFAASALVLAAVGVYGVTTYVTRQRTREMAIRVALGAAPASIVRLVMRHGVRIAVVGVATGLALALSGSRYLRVYLYEVSPLDVWAHAAVATALASVVLIASYLPARRAARVDPVASLKRE
jgi:putative ABC transport system permease protein